MKELLYNNDEDVITTYGNMIYHIALSKTGTKHDAEDIFQEVFMKYLKKKPKFNNEEHRKAWFIRVTVNCTSSFFTNVFRKKTRNITEDLIFIDKEMQDLSTELHKIPQKYREVIYLFYYEEMSINEIGIALNRKNSTVRTQLTRARSMLKEFMDMEDYYV
ncbi:MAG: sigma-70 family RNA polymerase sigma factor [Lachnospiraceae bacterium]|nr:sigma-70 family RNA polymerase sigma factor [Lachnospiraceae bacterium]